MKRNLEQIDLWLEKHASKILEYSLQDGALKDDLDELEKEVGRELPADFRALYLWHDGMIDDENTGSLFYGMEFCSLEKAIEDLQDRKSRGGEQYALDHVDPGIDSIDCNNVYWIMIGFDGSHTRLYLDLAPTIQGKYGQVIFVDEEFGRGILVADSIECLVEKFVHDLTNNLYKLNKDALEDDEHFLDPKKSIDIVNWSMSKEWKR